MKRYELTSSQKLIYQSEKTIGKESSLITGITIIKGEDNIEKLELAAKEVLGCIDAMRIKICETSEGPKQIFLDSCEELVERIDFNNTKEMEEYIGKYNEIDIEGRLYKLIVSKVGGNSLGIIGIIHHIISDAWSMLLIVNNILDYYYDDFCKDSMFMYSDYIIQNKEYLSGKSFERSLQYWKSKIKEIGEADPVYTKRSLCYDSIRTYFKINKALSEKINNFAAKSKCSPYSLFMSALAIYINRNNNVSNFYIGTSVLNRVNRKEKNTFGMFVNTIPLNFYFNDKVTFLEVLTSTAKEIRLGFRHQRCNYGKILEEANCSKGLFDIVLSFQNASLEEKYKNVEMKWIAPKKQANPLQIHLLDYCNSGEYDMLFDYHTDLFTEAEIENMYKHILFILEQGIDNPEILIDNMDLITQEEKDEILNVINSPVKYKYEDRTAVEIFEEQAEKYKDKVALIYENTKVTYGELNEKANKLAIKLRALGLKQEDVAALYTERNIEMIIGLLAVLKAGAAYVPLDITYPEERINYILQDSSAKMLLHGKKSFKGNTNIVLVDLYDENNYSKESGNIERINKPEDLAYIIYTSGTTGNPKGVMIEHRNLCSLKNVFKEFGVKDTDVILQFANLVFDASVYEIWMAFMNGAALVLVSKDLLLDVQEFLKVSKKNNISIAVLPPQYFLQLEGFNPRILFTAGSSSSREVLEKIGNNTQYYNAYGPTENTIISTYWKYDKGKYLNNIIPIGKPAANTKVYIMKNNRLCAKGMKGEICVAGLGVARGYLGREDLNEKSFIDNPFEEGKIYKTGDLGLYLPNGEIQYLGRVDEQIKIRGFRVELQEIETQIRKLSYVQDAAVTAFKDDNGEYSIYSYIVCDKDLNKKHVINALNKVLPDYMIPKFIVKVNKIPVTSSGKVDKKALKKVEVIDRKNFTLAESEMEKLISEVFKEVLNLKKVSILDNFFEIGGDSIKAIRISTRLHELGYELGVKDILTLKNVKELAKIVLKTSDLNKYYQGEITGEVYKTPIIDEFFNWNLKNINHFNQGCMMERESFDENKVKAALEEIIKHHDVLRMSLKGDKLYINSFQEAKKCNVEVYNLLEAENVNKEIEALCEELQESISLSKGNLIKAAIFRTKDKDELFICMHHLIVDGFSWRIILDDFIKVYLENNTVLQDKTASFIEWGKKLNTLKENGFFEDDYSYWKDVVETGNKYPIPYDKNQEDKREKISFILDKSVTNDLVYKGSKFYKAKINELMIASLINSINNEKLCLHLEGHGRNLVDDDIKIDRTVGWFTSLYPVKFEGKGTLEECIYNTKETLRNIENREIGYGLLKHKLPSLNRNICFNYLGDFSDVLSDDFMQLSNYSMGELNAVENGCIFDISIDCAIYNGSLKGDIQFNLGKYSREFITELIEKWKHNLKKIADVKREEVMVTPSDMGKVFITEKDFEVLKNKFDINNIKALYNLTYLQEGMLYYKQLDENSTSYILQNVVKIKDTSSEIIEKAIDFIGSKYDILRTNFLYKKVTSSVQVVLKDKTIERRVIDYKGADFNTFIKELLEQDLRRGFNLEDDSLLRIIIVKNKEVNHVIWTFHHIIMDGWCIGLLLKEFLEICRKIKNKEDLPNDKESVFGEYVNWLRNKPVKAGLNYWSKLLKGYDESVSINPVEKHKGNEDNTVKTTVLHINENLKEKILALSKEKNITVNTIFETALGICLQKYNKQDVVFGKIVSGRNAKIKGIEAAVGLFINTIPVRVKSRENMSCLELLQEVQKESIESLAFDYCPLVEIQKVSDLGQDLFKVLLVFENYDTLNFNNEDIECEYVREETSYDLTLSVYLGENIKLEAMYYNSMYKDYEVDLLLSRVTKVLEDMTSDYNMLVEEVSLLKDDELNLILKDFNKTDISYPVNKVISEVFEKQVKKNPYKAAVKYLDEVVSYEELNKKANNLAYKLRKLNIGQNDFVAVFSDRGINLIVSILGIIKAGAAYVPIDIKYPDERIQYILRDCNPKCIVTDSKESVERFNIEYLEVNSKDELVYEENLEIVNKPEDLLYMIYTSGTTGNPKGVMIEHHSLINMIFAYKDLYNITEEDVILQFASIAFDQSVWDIFSSILLGATLVMVPQDIIGDSLAIPEYCNKHKVTIAALTPAFIKELKPEDFNFLRILESGGAAAELNILNKWREKVEIFNTYGPTETTVNAISYKYEDCFNKNDIMPIGKPISNLKIYILKNNKLCAVGIAGQLCIAGEGVARGYFNREDLTKEKFISNPFDEGRLYKTGDLARWLPDGNIEYLGRIDQQVKIRGFRIELGEIESVLRDIKEIDDAVVTAVEDKTGDKRLCAYLTSKEEINLHSLKKYLGQILPKYMIPSAMMQLDKIPLTVNGKVNKRELPFIENFSSEDYIAPRNEIENTLSEIFCNVLGVDKAGINDDFFELGGHSLKAVKLVNEIESSLKVRLKISDIFENPVLSSLAELISNEKTRVYEKIEKIEEKPYYEMSSVQRRLYTLNEMEENSVAYNMPGIIKIKGKLDIEKVKEAFNEIILRHEGIRTSFHRVEDKLYQRVNNNVEMPIEVLKDLNDEDIKRTVEEFVQPFDLEKAPLMRVKIIEEDTENFRILFDMHHIISDGVSINIILKEFVLLYKGVTLEKQELSYKDYSNWIRNRDVSSQKEYWENTFKDGFTPLNLPLDYKRPKVRSYKGNRVYSLIDKDLMKEVKDFALKTDTTEYMIFLAVYMMVLSKYSGQENIFVGTPVSGRVHKDTENMVGMFVNTLVMNGQPKKELTFKKFLESVKDMSIKAFENQEYHFEDLVEKLVKERDLSRNPCFDVMMALEDESESENLSIDGLKISLEEINNNVSKFDISLNIAKRKEDYKITAEYCSDLFTEETMKFLLIHFKNLLINAIRNKDMTIENISALDLEEESRILKKFSKGEERYRDNKTIIEVFEESVIKNRNNTAVIYNDEALTYDEFNKKVNKLSALIRSKGICRNDYVAILLERSIDAIAAVFAVLKAGAAYVPIDVKYSKDRIKYMIKDSSSKLIILDDEKDGKELKDTIEKSIIMSNKEYEKYDDSNLEVIHKGSDLAYMIYTSGTTGKPKGVEVTHDSLKNLIFNLQEDYSVKEGDSYLFKTSYTFDVSLNELFGWIFNGGKLIILNKDGEKDPIEIAETIDKNKITHIVFVPSMLKLFLNTIKEREEFYLSSVKYFITCGEPIDFETAKLCYKLFKNAELINLYGPTEATIYSTGYKIDTKVKGASIPIGKPLANYRTYIFDSNMKLSPIGMIGELYIGGKGLAKGYKNREDLTKKSYIINPYNKEEIIYKTGDMARWLIDGNIECLGRIDDQVKIRGFRIELGEVENAIRKISYIKDAAVIIKEDTTGEKEIYAYIVSEEKVKINDFKEEIRKTLPQYMIPSYFMQIKEIPLSASGKLNKKLLPAIEKKSENEYVKPRNKVEETICNIFSEILSLEKAGINDNFFELGGNSLRATRAANAIENSLNVRIPLKKIFELPTPKLLAEVVLSMEKTNYKEIPKAEEKDFYPMSSPQKRLFLIDKIDDTKIAYNMPYALDIGKNIDIEKIKIVFNKIIERHEILRTSFHMEEEAVQKIHKNVKINIEYEDVRNMKEEQVKKVLNSFVRKFDLSKAPLMRVKVVETKETNLLLFDMHHIITDGWSMNLLINEFNSLYKGEELEENRLQYKDYSEWMKSRDLKKEKEYWLKEFKEEVEPLNLPTDFIRGQKESFQGDSVKYIVPKEIKEKLETFTKETKTTEYMVMLSALMVLLKKYSRQGDIVIGSPIAGRLHKDTEKLLGMFVNTLPIKGKVDDNKSFEEFLEEIKETTLKAYKNQEYPFEELVENLHVKRVLSRNALFDVMFTMQNNENTKLDFVHNNKIKFDIGENIAKFDLSVTVNSLQDKYEVIFEYRSDLYKKETMTNMINHYINILSQVLDKRKLKIKEIQTATEAEKTKILKEFNSNEYRYSQDINVVTRFEEEVLKHPDKIALEYDDKKLTYKDLNNKANALAEKLIDLGVEKEDFIALMGRKSINTVIGICAIVKAGCAYVPVDISYPKERIDYMIEDSKPKAILIEDFEYDTEIPLVDIKTAVNLEGREENLKVERNAEDLIYVIYTSGTTGKPKGVMVESRSVFNLVYNQNYLDFENIALLQGGSLSFDAATFEIWCPLLNGGRLHLENKEVILDVKKLKDTIEKYEINTMLITTALFNKLIDLDAGVFDTMTNLLFGGEKASENHIHKLLERNHKIKLVNVYGPTEATTFAACKTIKHCDVNEEVTIGQTISGAQNYIISDSKLCGIGVPGELYVAGIGVARGYYNREELTAEKFTDNPFGPGKIYATGDLASWVPDGNIRYLGRIDSQVKLRGFRIELGEIENAFRTLKEVKDITVLFKRKDNGESAIYAYIVKADEVSIHYIKEEVKKLLPEYMIPAYMMFIEDIPLTVNGKVDKRKLPEIQGESSKDYIEPVTDTEKIIAKIFQEILNVDKVGLKDDFFELGGHSIKAISAVNKINKKCTTDISVKDLFQLQTVESLARKAEENKLDENLVIKKCEEKENYLLSPGQKRMIIVNSLNENSTSYNLPFKLKIEGDFNEEKFKDALNKLIARHEALRTEFIITNEGPRQVIKDYCNIDVPIIKAEEMEIDNLFTSFIIPFKLDKSPLMRCMIVKTSLKVTYVFMDMHHILVDGASVSIIIKDLLAFYNEEQVEKLDYQYKDYCEWINKVMVSEGYNKSREYWLEKFKGELPKLNICEEKERRDLINCKCNSRLTYIDKELYKKADKLIKEMNISWFMLLLSAYSIMLYKYSAQKDIIIGSPILGREKEEWESVVGMFVNMIPIRCRIDTSKTIKDFIIMLKNQCLDSFRNNIYQFDQLVEELNIERSNNRNPVFDVTFSMQNISIPEVSVKGLDISIDSISKDSKYDLMLFALEEDERVKLELEYRMDLFTEEIIKDMMDSFINIIDFITKNLDEKVNNINFVEEETALEIENTIEEDRENFDFDFDF